jgi:hypothetical protein
MNGKKKEQNEEVLIITGKNVQNVSKNISQ